MSAKVPPVPHRCHKPVFARANHILMQTALAPLALRPKTSKLAFKFCKGIEVFLIQFSGARLAVFAHGRFYNEMSDWRRIQAHARTILAQRSLTAHAKRSSDSKLG